jgi:2-polyprenyl-3-methyl-5-hydroxy-6-metoxy-1,4-benzoquinol methylase
MLDTLPKRTVTGNYVNGCGKASVNAAKPGHTSVQLAGVNLLGTYNVEVTDKEPFKGLLPGRVIDGVSYWPVSVNGQAAWAMRWEGSKQPQNRLEIYSRVLLEQQAENEITIYGALKGTELVQFQHDAYRAGHKWFQAHKWLLPKYRRHDANIIVPKIGNVQGLTVLDFGSCEGQVAHALARAGAKVTATDKRSAPLGEALSRHIECQDVEWIASDKVPEGTWDIVLSLSVWHQEDPHYTHLAAHLDELRSRASQSIYVELMTPPIEGNFDVYEFMKRRGAEWLYSYKHKVRRQRTVYRETV